MISHLLGSLFIKCIIQGHEVLFTSVFNHLNPHDASKHYFAAVKNDLTSYT